MDRLTSRWAGCGLALALTLAVTGCKSMKSDVPAGPTFAGTGQQPPPSIGFSSAPNPADASAGPTPNGSGQYGVPNPSGAPSYGVSNAAFGGPGSSGLSAPTGGGAGSAAPGMGGLPAPGGASNPMTGIPQTGTGSTGPAAGIGAPTQSPY